MCGFAGFIGTPMPRDLLEDQAARMAATLVHRGPDDGHCWSEPEAGMAMGFRRLAILDLSPQGRQPMESHCGRYVIALNGEIYNYGELREKALAACHGGGFRGGSDTEALLAAIGTLGLEASLQSARGMFALAVWDRKDRVLWLARDRFGEKPLYYGWNGGAFLFGSELKALREFDGFTGQIDPDVLALYMRHQYVPAPYSIYRGIFKLLPGSILKVSAPAPSPPSSFSPWSTPRSYWSLQEVISQQQRFAGSYEEAIDELEQVLGDAVSAQTVADVPLGAFLSGGIDSSLIVALMQQRSSKSVRTFTIGFEEDAFDERPHARAIAEVLGTDHCEMVVTPSDTLGVVPLLPDVYDEPFADSSQIPTYCVAKMARSEVTVALSGDGGDELFGGYGRYQAIERVWRHLERVPRPMRLPVGAGLRAMPGSKLHRLGHAMLSGFDAMYRDRVSQWKKPQEVVPAGIEPRTMLDEGAAFLPAGFERMMVLDAVSYLPDDVMVKVDRASMAVGLESRAPMLDHRVAELAWRLPESFKAQAGSGKKVLKSLLGRHLPRELVERPKKGFSVPVGEWLRGPLRDWADDLLDREALRRTGLLDEDAVRRAWFEHLEGRKNRKSQLWTVLMFQAWAARMAK
ncbi:MAG TPA: asparagine synthase (glutamine-hydrolyzing) [Fimbriimonadaceae bacterium]|nr:asparagine synthase (glutamine-hydrolyzing) [Fimbriimonadaceae bacterium]